jgi:hypothetical protein
MSDRELNTSMRAHWVLLLRLSATENRSVNCGTNNRLVISPDGLDSYCQCIDNRNCDDGGNWRSKWNLAVASTVSVSVLIIFYLIVSIVHHINKIQFFHEYRLRLHENDAAKEELIKGE